MQNHTIVVCESEDLSVVINELLMEGILEEELDQVMYELCYERDLNELDLSCNDQLYDAMNGLVDDWEKKGILELIGTPFLKINPPTGKFFYLET